IAGEFESVAQMGLQIVLLPEAVDRVLADSLLPGHRAATPMGHAFGLGLQRGSHNRGGFLLAIGGFSPAPRPDFPQPLQSLVMKSPSPQCRSVTIDAQLGSDLQVLFSLTS